MIKGVEKIGTINGTKTIGLIHIICIWMRIEQSGVES